MRPPVFKITTTEIQEADKSDELIIVQGSLGGRVIDILIDGGANGNFVDPDIVKGHRTIKPVQKVTHDTVRLAMATSKTT